MTPPSSVALVLLAGATPAFFAEAATLAVVGAAIAYLCHRVGLLPIVGFLVTGVAIGPNALGLVTDRELVDAVAELGVVLLLFTIGIEFSLEKLARIQRLIFVGGGLQVGLVTLAVTGILALFGVGWRTGVFTGFLVALSSTAIVLKVLGERAQMQTAAGRVSVGVLIFQDLAIIPMVLVVPMLGAPLDAGGGGAGIALALGKAAAIVVGTLLLARRVMPWLLEKVARTCSQELFLLTVIAICFGTAWLTGLAGLSLSLGAFLAGLIVSESRYASHALGEILPLQILFNAAFFISVGMLLDLGFLVDHVMLVGGAVLGILAVKAAATAFAARILREPVGTSLAVGLGLAQVGEFSFVLERSGREVGLMPFGVEGSGGQVLIASTVVLMAVTPWLLSLGTRLAARDADAGGRVPEPEPDAHSPLATLENHVVVAGYGAAARPLVQVLLGARVPFGVVTLSPTGAEEAGALGIGVLLGDATRARTLQLAGVERAKALVVPDDEPAMAHRVVAVARSLNPTMHVAVRTRRRAEVAELVAAGADEVVAEELEGVVQLFRDVLRNYSIGADEVRRHEDALRRDGYAALVAAQGGRAPALDCTLGDDCLDRRRVRLRAGAPAAGSALGTLALDARHGLEALAVLRDGADLRARAELELAAGDELELRGTARAFASAAALFRVPTDAAPEGVEAAPTAADAIDGATRRVAFDTETALSLDVDPRTSRCAHAADLRPAVPQTSGCAECLADGHDDWVHLRLCMACGHVGCCDDSPGKHATAHWNGAGHPVIRSLEPGERWGWCFADGVEP